MAKKEVKTVNLEGLVEEIEANIEALKTEMWKAEGNASAARRARKLTSELSKQFKEFRAISVAHHKK